MSGQAHSTDNIVPFSSPAASIAIVHTACKGQAHTLVQGASAAPISVAGHLSQVPFLRQGDQVLIVSTAIGPVITGKLRSEEEKPAIQDEEKSRRFVVDAPEGICLQAGLSRLELTPDGRIWLDGEEIYQVSSGRMRLQGATIELN